MMVSSSCSFSSGSGGVNLATGAIVGIAVGSAAGAALVCSLVFFVCFRRHLEQSSNIGYAGTIATPAQAWSNPESVKPSQGAAVAARRVHEMEARP
jgi:hypothetical protein